MKFYLFLLLFSISCISSSVNEYKTKTCFILDMPYLSVPLEKQSLLFCIDTGSPYCILDSSFYSKITPNKKRQINSEKGKIYLRKDSHTETQFGVFDIKEITCCTDGLIGGNFLIDKIVKFDYKNDTITFLTKSELKNYLNFDSLKLKIKNNKPYFFGNIVISETINISGDFLIDTGFWGGIKLHNDTFESKDFEDKILLQKVVRANFTGDESRVLFKTREFRSGNFVSASDIAYFKKAKTYKNSSKSSIGTVGNKILSKYIIILDYPKEVMYFKKNKTKATDCFFHSGISIGKKVKDGFKITGLIYNSPADSLNIKIGDVLIECNNVKADENNYAKISKMLKGQKSLLRLLIKRNDSIFEKQVPVKKLL